jgi:glycosyltransferase involved in cell wall biosynthesis
MNEKISVVIPAYNESKHIAENLRTIVASLASLADDFEILLIDDGSIDETWRHAAESDQGGPGRLRVLRYAHNMGKGYALACGARFASGTYTVFLDADLDLHPDQLSRFFETMRSLGADAVVGSKWHPASTVSYPRWRRFLSRGYYSIVRLMFGLPLRDTQTGLKVFRSDALARVVPRLLAKRFAFDVELLAVMHRMGYTIVEAPVDLQFRRALPRLRLSDVCAVFIDTLAIFYRLHIRRYYDKAPAAENNPSSEIFESPQGTVLGR